METCLKSRTLQESKRKSMPVLQATHAKMQNIKKHTNVILVNHFLLSLMRALQGTVMSLN